MAYFIWFCTSKLKNVFKDRNTQRCLDFKVNLILCKTKTQLERF